MEKTHGLYSALKKKHVFNPSSYLYDEPHFLLQQEVTEIGSYFSLIKTIAAIDPGAKILYCVNANIGKRLKELVNKRHDVILSE